MKTQLSNKAFTAVELLVVLGIVALLIGMLLPALSRTNAKPSRINCINNLKQIGVGFRLYATDGAPYPEYVETNEVWRNFQEVGREIGSPKVLLCPKDTARADLEAYPVDFAEPATPTSFGHPKFRDTTLSYFFNPDASEDKPEMILSGDRNVSTNMTMISGLLSVETDTPAQWTGDIHVSAGNILLADGSAQQVGSPRLRRQIELNTNGTQRFLIPE